MANARKSAKSDVLTKDLLLLLAERLGPGIDRVDPSTDNEQLVRDLVVKFDGSKQASPAEVRFAILLLNEAGWVRVTKAADADLSGPHAAIELTLRGLMQAREWSPDVDKPARRFQLLLGDGSRYRARFDTGSASWDSKLNRRGSVLALLYGLGLHQPTKAHPVQLSELMATFDALARFAGVRAKSGPSGTRHLGFTEETVREAADHLRELLPGLKVRGKPKGLPRCAIWMEGPWPSILVHDPEGRIETWAVLLERLRRVVKNEGELDELLEVDGKKTHGLSQNPVR